MLALELKNLTLSIGDKNLIENLSLELNKNEFLGILGPSGIGKTTLLKSIAGLSEPTKGEITSNDKILFSESLNVLPKDRQMSFVFQDLALWPHLTAEKNVLFNMPTKIPKKEASTKVRNWLNLVEFPDTRYHAYPHELSGGEKQRIAIARAIAAEPNLILLDEPFSHCDAQLKENLIDLLLNLKSKLDLSMICVSHDEKDLKTLCDNIVFFDDQKLKPF